MEPRILWYAQSAVRIDAGGLIIYIDPYQLPEGQPPADVMLISHHHRDHLSPDDLAKVRTERTTVFASPAAAPHLNGPVQVLAPGETAQHGPLRIRAVPAYNLTKFRSPGVPFHPRDEQHTGFVLEIDDLTFYFAADTDVIPEMDEIGPVDYAFLPVSGTYVMTAEEAAEAARRVQPSVAIPVHYGSVVGSVADAQRFAELVPDQVRVWIMEPA
ncbi:MAG: MBL fold metallo-hydrolase [Sphaerobacter sp.]|nr:MBL fold metallo-hydrolase [Sphaerobacter sp.]